MNPRKPGPAKESHLVPRSKLLRQGVLWAVLTLASSIALTAQMVDADADRSIFTPGTTSHGHYQIEMQCSTCHTEAFDDGASLQKACEQCHGQELHVANDSHPTAKFTDPRNAHHLDSVDARRCVACHTEHDPEATLAAGLTLPEDFCYECHADIGEERPTHQGIAFNTCASGGCHNFHDNRALYEDFLVAHLDAPPHAVDATVPKRREAVASLASLSASHQDGPDRVEPRVVTQWAESKHAQTGTNCSGCHGDKDAFSELVSPVKCRTCHEDEYNGWTKSLHGMRVGAGLAPMNVAQARSPMKPGVGHLELTCNSCHAAHSFDTNQAAFDACVSCHDDEHSRAYVSSPHFRAWTEERNGLRAPGTGVSCATCHLPRVEISAGGSGATEVRVEHNQNDNLRPNEKMIRSVCIQCHGVPFTLDALADEALVRRNFAGLPARHVESVDFVRSRLDP